MEFNFILIFILEIYFDKGFVFETNAEPSSEQSTLSYVFL